MPNHKIKHYFSMLVKLYQKKKEKKKVIHVSGVELWDKCLERLCGDV